MVLYNFIAVDIYRLFNDVAKQMREKLVSKMIEVTRTKEMKGLKNGGKFATFCF